MPKKLVNHLINADNSFYAISSLNTALGALLYATKVYMQLQR